MNKKVFFRSFFVAALFGFFSGALTVAATEQLPTLLELLREKTGLPDYLRSQSAEKYVMEPEQQITEAPAHDDMLSPETVVEPVAEPINKQSAEAPAHDDILPPEKVVEPVVEPVNKQSAEAPAHDDMLPPETVVEPINKQSEVATEPINEQPDTEFFQDVDLKQDHDSEVSIEKTRTGYCWDLRFAVGAFIPQKELFRDIYLTFRTHF